MIASKYLTTKQGLVMTLTLTNQNGTAVTVTPLGASLLSFKTKDKHGQLTDIVLGFETLDEYFDNTNSYFGGTVGRVANRTQGAQFSLNGETFQIPQNEGHNNLHSGPDGYQLRLWEMDALDEANNKVTFKLESPEGDQGYPGNLTLKTTYQLTQNNQLTISYQAVSDKDTPFSPTNHSYFNLNGHASGSIANHQLQLKASHYTPIQDAKSIPTGDILNVEGTAFDFRKSKTIGQDIEQALEQLQLAHGYDHNFAINSPGLEEPFATVIGDQSGITLDVFTNLPGVQFYTGNFLGEIAGKEATNYPNRSGFCLETQHFPNAINTPTFPSPILKANTPVIYETIYKVRS